MLVWVVVHTLHVSWLRVVGAAIIFATALSKDVFFWNKAILTESISNSGYALAVAALVWGISRASSLPAANLPQLKAALPLITAMSLWGLARDLNAYFILCFGVLILGGLAMQRKKFWPQRYFWGPLAIACLVIFLVQNITANHGRRWQFPLVNVLSQRILVDPVKTEFFARRGMPTNEKVMRFKNQWASSFDADWSGFGPWLDAQGKSTYMQFLLSQPLESLWQPVARWREFFSSDPYGYSGMKTAPMWQRAMSDVVSPTGRCFLLMGVLALAVFGYVWKKGRLTTPARLAALIVVLTYPVLFICWHGDAMEVVRHCVGATLQARLGIWLVLLFCFDGLFSQAPASAPVH